MSAASATSPHPAPDRPRVAILILNWNGWADTLECLESVLRLDYPEFQVILCDNGSTDGSVERVRDWAGGRLDILPERAAMGPFVQPPVAKPVALRLLDRAGAERAPAAPTPDPEPVVLIRTGGNLGFAGGNNVGLRYALGRGFSYVWVLNADTVVPPGALAPLVARMRGDPGIGLCGSLLCYYDAPDILQEAGGCAYSPMLATAVRLARDRPVAALGDPGRIEARLGYVSAASCLVSAAFLREVGPMAEDYFLYCEEIDWATRARGRFRLALAPQSVVYHKKGRATGSTSFKARRSAGSSYFLWRARRRFTQRHYPLGLAGLFALGTLAAARALLGGDGAGARAIWAGLRNRPRG